MKIQYSLNEKDLQEILGKHFKETYGVEIKAIEVELKETSYRNSQVTKEFDCINVETITMEA